MSCVGVHGSNIIMDDGVGNTRKFPCRRRRAAGSCSEGSESSSNTNASRGVVVIDIVVAAIGVMDVEFSV